MTESSVQCQIRLKLSILLCTKLCAFIHPAQRKTCLSITKPAVTGPAALQSVSSAVPLLIGVRILLVVDQNRRSR